MPTITADKVLYNNLFAKSTVYGYGSDFATVKKVFTAPDLIGNVYSYIEQPDGLYWMVYVSPYDFDAQNPTYIKHNADKLSLPALPGILAEVQKEQDAKDLASKGILQYNIDKYGKYIIGAAVVAIAAPTVLNMFNNRKKVSGMKKDNTLLIIGAAALAFYIYSKKKKTKAGAPIIEDLPVDDPFGNKLPNDTQCENYSVNPSGSAQVVKQSFATDQTGGGVNQGLQRITSVGIFPVTYGNAMAGRKGDLGSIKMN